MDAGDVTFGQLNTRIEDVPFLPTARLVSTTSPLPQGRDFCLGDSIMKRCGQCGVEKPETEFYRRAKAPWFRRECKRCTLENQKLYQTTHKQQKAVIGRAYRLAHKQERRLRQTAYGQKHSDRLLERLQERRRSNPARYRAYSTVGNHIRSGQLIRPSECSQCGKTERVVAHHVDYERPLDVTWLCRTCHARVHGLMQYEEITQ